MGSFNRDGLEKVMAMYADDVQFEDVTFAHKVSGKVELRKFFAGFFDPGSGEHLFTVTNYTGGTDAGAAEWTWRGKHGGEFLGAPAAGKTTEARGVSVLTFHNGKIASQHDYWDSGTVLRQLGAIK
ncbi:MAG: ester cyclase [Candidatus Binataceae bacterium]